MKWLLILTSLWIHDGLAATLDRIQFSGYASVRGTYTNDVTLDFEKDFDFKEYNVVGVQLKGQVSDKTSVTMVTNVKGDSDYDITVDWVYLTYILPENSLINIGRLGIPVYTYSDVKDINFTHDWSYLPKSVYRFTYSIIDGVSLYRNFEYGPVDATLQVMYGGFKGDVIVANTPSETELEDFVGVFATTEVFGLTTRVAWSKTNVDVNAIAFNPVFSALRPDIYDRFWTNGVDAFFRGVSLKYIHQNITVVSELVVVDIRDSFFDTRDGAYVSMSYTIDQWRPYIMVEHEDFKVDRSTLTDYTGQIPQRSYLLMEQILDFEKRRKTTLHVGARYDYTLRSAFKLQYSHEYNHRTGGTTGVLGLGIDVVF